MANARWQITQRPPEALITFHASRFTHHVSRPMNTNLQSPIAPPRSLSGEGVAAIAGAIGSAFLLAKKLLGPKAAKPEPMSRADFYAETLASRERSHADHLALLEKLDANHRELLAALERQATRINALETGLARVDERTK
jgi:hypothetical protein